MSYNIKPSAPPLDTLDENIITREEGQTIKNYNSYQQPIQQPIQQPQGNLVYTSFPYSYPVNKTQSLSRYYRLPFSNQINYATKQGQNCVCIYCRNYQKTRVKSKCSLFSYLCAFGLVITGCCCFYPCFHEGLKNQYHYCSNCHRLLGHS